MKRTKHDHSRTRRTRQRPLHVEFLEDRHLLAAMPQLVKQFKPFASPTLIEVGDVVFFVEDELWKSDGTAAGTMGVKDINLSNDSNSRYLTNVNGTLYFSADDGQSGFELWKSDGTETGTVRLTDNFEFGGHCVEGPRSLTNVNGTLYFISHAGGRPDGSYGLWKSDGTKAGTVRVKQIQPGVGCIFSGGSLTNVNGTVFFTTDDHQSGVELWKSDGTEGGTARVKDIAPGNYGSNPSSLTNVNGTLFFTAKDGQYELWKSDGTDVGTVRVIILGDRGSYPSLTNVNGTLYLRADDGQSGYELWKSNGTEAGTVRVKDINDGNGFSNAEYLTNSNGTLYFSADDGQSGNELWKSDGTEVGTVRVRDINPGKDGGCCGSLTNVDGMLYFRANDGIAGSELWTSDAAGTRPGHSTPWRRPSRIPI